MRSRFRNRPPLWKRDAEDPGVTLAEAPDSPSNNGEDAESATRPLDAQHLKRKSPQWGVAPDLPDLKRRSMEPQHPAPQPSMTAPADAHAALSALQVGDSPKRGRGSSMDCLEESTLILILSRLPGREAARVAAVCRRWAAAVGSDQHWEAQCARAWGLNQPRTADLEPASFRDSFVSWDARYRGYGRLAVRARIAWWVLESWASNHHHGILSTLRGGAAEVHLAAAERALGVSFPPAMRMLYRIHDGQHLPGDAAADTTGACDLNSPDMLRGLFGGYSYYDQVVSLRLFPLARVVTWTMRLRQQVLKTSAPDSRVVIAGNFNMNKLVVVDCNTGLVKACLSDKSTSVPAAPADTRPGACDGMLRWVEEYAKRLREGQYVVDVLPPPAPDPVMPPARAISLFPAKPPVWTWAVTRGVMVRVTTVFLPEKTRGVTPAAGGGAAVPPKFMFAYSVELSLLGLREQRECGVSRPEKRVQLRSRHWIVRNAAGKRMQEVRGEGVNNVSPVLIAGGEPFSYQSCTPQERLPAILQGEFTFVAGAPTDSETLPFAVRIPTLVLKLPSYIY